MADNIKERWGSISEKLKVGGAEASRKFSLGMTSFGGKLKEMLLVSSQADKLVEEATAENLVGPDWHRNLELCDLVNNQKISGQDAVRAIKKRIMFRNSTVQVLALTLLETSVKNCEKMFSEVASEKVLDEMVKIIDDRLTPTEIRDKALVLIEAWGESSDELRYLPVFEETYKSLKSRGIKFPGRDAESLAPIFTPPQTVAARVPTDNSHERQASGAPANHGAEDPKEVLDVARNSVELLSTVLTSSPQSEVLKDDLTTTLVEQCRQSQYSVQRIIERAGDNDPVMFEALNVNDELQRVLSKYEESTQGQEVVQEGQQPSLAQVEALEEDDTQAGGREDALHKRFPRIQSLSPDSGGIRGGGLRGGPGLGMGPAGTVGGLGFQDLDEDESDSD